MQQHQLAELMCGFSHALDLAEGQPAGHAVRCAYLGMHLARAIDLAPADQWELYYTLLLKDLGGSSNAARIHDVFLSDDLRFKRKAKRFADHLPPAAQLALSQTGARVGLLARVRATLRALAAKGYEGPLSVELFLPQFQDGDPWAVATDVRRKTEAVIAAAGVGPDVSDGRG